MHSPHTAPTFLRSFLVSITFSFYVLGLTGGESCFTSARLKGAVRQSYLRKRKRGQRDPLIVELPETFRAEVQVAWGSGFSCYAFT